MIQIDLNNEKIDFPGQQPIHIHDWQDQKAKSGISDKDKKLKYASFENKINTISHQDQDKLDQRGGYVKKREYK